MRLFNIDFCQWQEKYLTKEIFVFIVELQLMVRILKAIFIILVLVTLGEFGYLYILTRSNQNKVAIDLTAQTINNSQYSKEVNLLTDNFNNSDIMVWVKNKGWNNSIKLNLVSEKSGSASEVGYDESGNAKLTLVDENGNRITTNIIHSKELIAGGFFFRNENGKKTEISFDEIKVGNYIEYFYYQNLMNLSDNKNEYIIYENQQ